MKAHVYALALVIAAIMVSTGAAWSVMSADVTRALDRDSNGNHDQNDSHGHNDTDNDDSHDNETHENATFVLDFAGGGGWFMAKNEMNMSFKNTFGLFLDGRAGSYNNSSMVLQARNMGMTIHMTVFNTIAFDNGTAPGNHTAHATGKAISEGKNWTFRLQITDMGKGDMDLFFLELKSGNTTLTFQTTGLGGGNITVEPLVDTDEMEDTGDQV